MSDALGRVADSTGNWVDRLAPLWGRPYLRLARLDRPIGSWLLLIPCWWSAGLAAIAAHERGPRLGHLILFFVGAFAMRGAGCTWNDIVDRDLDRGVERTRSRSLDVRPLVLYAGSIAWVIGYDTVYAHQDREDDALIGIKSTALLFGDRTKPMLAIFYGLAVALIGLAGTLAGAGRLFWLGLAAFAAHLGWQIVRLDIHDPDVCLAVFKSDRDAGLVLFAGIVADALWRG
jgi:4-hydroxybenzoate polyprenyltransferase